METMSAGLALVTNGTHGCQRQDGEWTVDPFCSQGAPALLREVLVDAIRIYCRAIALDGTWSPEYREARRWLFDEDSRSLLSFVTLCEIFALNARELRRSLRLFPYEPDPRLMRIARLVDEDDSLRRTA